MADVLSFVQLGDLITQTFAQGPCVEHGMSQMAICTYCKEAWCEYCCGQNLHYGTSATIEDAGCPTSLPQVREGEQADSEDTPGQAVRSVRDEKGNLVRDTFDFGGVELKKGLQYKFKGEGESDGRNSGTEEVAGTEAEGVRKTRRVRNHPINRREGDYPDSPYDNG